MRENASRRRRITLQFKVLRDSKAFPGNAPTPRGSGICRGAGPPTAFDFPIRRRTRCPGAVSGGAGVLTRIGARHREGMRVRTPASPETAPSRIHADAYWNPQDLQILARFFQKASLVAPPIRSPSVTRTHLITAAALPPLKSPRKRGESAGFSEVGERSCPLPACGAEHYPHLLAAACF